MADLPPSTQRIFQPTFYSTGVDCFGPYVIKVGRRNEKRWGILFKCMTTRAVHVDLLSSIDTDAFLMALRRFKVFPGAYHHVRSAEALVKDRTYTRPVARLIRLPALPEEGSRPLQMFKFTP